MRTLSFTSECVPRGRMQMQDFPGVGKILACFGLVGGDIVASGGSAASGRGSMEVSRAAPDDGGRWLQGRRAFQVTHSVNAHTGSTSWAAMDVGICGARLVHSPRCMAREFTGFTGAGGQARRTRAADCLAMRLQPHRTGKRLAARELVFYRAIWWKAGRYQLASGTTSSASGSGPARPT